LQLEAISSELLDVIRLQGVIQHDNEALAAAVELARTRLEAAYKRDPDLRLTLEQGQPTTEMMDDFRLRLIH
jgi:hypothetical protein